MLGQPELLRLLFFSLFVLILSLLYLSTISPLWSQKAIVTTIAILILVYDLIFVIKLFFTLVTTVALDVWLIILKTRIWIKLVEDRSRLFFSILVSR